MVTPCVHPHQGTPATLTGALTTSWWKRGLQQVAWCLALSCGLEQEVGGPGALNNRLCPKKDPIVYIPCLETIHYLLDSVALLKNMHPVEISSHEATTCGC